jgi:hypothetical protein
MKQISVAKLNELLISLKAQRVELLEEKSYMLSHCEFDCREDEMEFDWLCDDIEDIELAIGDIYSIMCHPQTIVEDDMIYYTEDIKLVSN